MDYVLIKYENSIHNLLVIFKAMIFIKKDRFHRPQKNGEFIEYYSLQI